MLSGTLELDDAYIGSGGGLRGRGTDKAPFIVGAERARRGKLAIRATLDCSGESYGEYAKWHIADSAHIRTDGWNGAKGGLKKRKGHDPKSSTGKTRTHGSRSCTTSSRTSRPTSSALTTA